MQRNSGWTSQERCIYAENMKYSNFILCDNRCRCLFLQFWHNKYLIAKHAHGQSERKKKKKEREMCLCCQKNNFSACSSSYPVLLNSNEINKCVGRMSTTKAHKVEKLFGSFFNKMKTFMYRSWSTVHLHVVRTAHTYAPQKTSVNPIIYFHWILSLFSSSGSTGSTKRQQSGPKTFAILFLFHQMETN